MSAEQFTALLAKLNEDAELREKLKGAADLDAAVAMAQEAVFDVSKADSLKHQAKEALELTDAELEGVTGGTAAVTTFTAAALMYSVLNIDCFQ